jgi:predicted DNA-binding transcriptional regulator YafY
VGTALVSFTSGAYRSELAEAPAYREVVPYGLLYGNRVHVVAAFPWTDEPANYRLDRMSDLRVAAAAGARPRDFDLDAYAGRSFGAFQEEPYDVVLRFVPEVADEFAAFRFHRSQAIAREPDGSTSSAFRPDLRGTAWWAHKDSNLGPDD